MGLMMSGFSWEADSRSSILQIPSASLSECFMLHLTLIMSQINSIHILSNLLSLYALSANRFQPFKISTSHKPAPP